MEQPVLASAEFSYLRFNQKIKNKNGKLPAVDILFGSYVVKARREGPLEFSFAADDFDKIETCLNNEDHVEMKIPLTGFPPSDHLTSRWLAKMALELLAYKWTNISDWNTYIIEHKELDPIRKFARAPRANEAWSFSKRRIYPDDAVTPTEDGQHRQMIYECDILATGTAEASEFYFVAAFFGMEYAINIGGDSMDGYYRWLDEHNHASPLYLGKNAGRRSNF